MPSSFLASPEYLEHLRDASAIAGMTLPTLIVPDEHQVVLGRMRFRYLDWGTAGKKPLLFLHGGGLTAHTWDLVCLALRADYRCLALDLRGHGDSEWSPEMDYAIAAHSGDVEALVDHLGLDGLGLVGMSLGGLTAIAYAGRHAARLSALVIVDSGPEGREEGARRIQEFVAAPAEFASIDEVIERALSFNPRRDPKLLRRSLQHNLRRMPDGKLTWKHDRRHRAKFDAEEWARRRQGLWDEVARITCPTLVVRGGRSDVFHDEDAEKLAKALPRGSWVRVEDAGHTVQGDNPRGLVAELRRFLDPR
ncbi:MAG TPA: alpha/beta hydrolase [Candidatus Acidoferrum sp.]|nr:alpha/beta hydrolase [Candidatus Acidoferrum sp.]